MQAFANAGLGEIYARTGKTAEAVKAYDLAVQLDAARAGQFLKNEALVFMQAGNADAQVTAAQKAIKAQPGDPTPYYFKANGLLKASRVDVTSKHIDLPPGCAEAYQKYLTLAPSRPLRRGGPVDAPPCRKGNEGCEMIAIFTFILL